MSGYKFDVFISYSRESAVGQWVENHFYDLLHEFLGPELSRDPKVFWDKHGVQLGDRWPEKLRDALKHSRCLVAIWTPRYRYREWCQIEWQTMFAREELLRSGGSSAEIVFPVIYSDGDEFTSGASARPIQYVNFKEYAYHRKVYQETKEFYRFNVAVKEMAEVLGKRIRQAPAWDPTWPVIEKPVIPPEGDVDLQRI